MENGDLLSNINNDKTVLNNLKRTIKFECGGDDNKILVKDDV